VKIIQSKIIRVLAAFFAVFVVNASQLSLEEAVKFAEGHAYDIKSAESDILKLRQQVVEALATLRPKVTLNAGYTRRLKGASAAFPGSNGTVRSVEVSPKTINTADIDLKMPLDLLGVNKRAVNVASLYEESYQETLCAIKSTVRHDTRIAYYHLLKSLATLEVTQSSERDIKERLDNVQKSYEVGESSKLDLSQFETEYRNALGNVITAKGQIKFAKNALNHTIGRELCCEISPVSVSEMPSYSDSMLESLIQYACTHRHEVLSLIKSVEATKETELFNAVGTTPSLQIGSNFHRDFIAKGLGSIKNNASLNASINWTVFDGGATKAKIEQARQDEKKSLITLSKLTSTIEQQVRSASIKLINAQDQIAVFQSAVQFAETTLSAQKASYEVKASYAEQVTAAETQLTQARSSLINARYDYLSAFADLQLAVGCDDLQKCLTAACKLSDKKK
jgi:outer membrane protein TolC